MPVLPNRLRDDALRFVLVLAGEKRPFEEGWQKTANYKHDHPRVIAHQGNLGVLTGGGLVVMDCDCREAERLARQLPETLVVGTSMTEDGFRKKHFYFRCPREKKIILMDYNTHLGEIQAKGQQCLVPPSRHPLGMDYEILEDRPIASVTEAVLLNTVSPFMTEEKAGGAPGGVMREETDAMCAEIKKRVKIPHLLEKYGFDISKSPTKCLWHESEGGKCFSFADDLWHCFHCGAGGSIFHLVMKHESVDFIKAKSILSELAGLDEQGETKKDSKYFEDSVFVPKFLADDIRRDFVFKTASGDGTMYVYLNGFYRENGEEIIAEEVARRMGKLHKAIHTSEVIALIRAQSYFQRAGAEVEKNLVNLGNGVFDIENNKLLPHNPDYFFTSKIPVDLKDGATCPAILKFLGEVLPEGDIPIVQELIGYCLYREYHIHKAFMLLGDGSNGKSTLLNLISAFLGFENTSGVSLQQFEKDRFAKAALFGKLANIYSDLSPDALYRTGIFKMLTGGDVIFADKKFKNPFSFRNHAKLMFSANILPDTKDDTSAFFRRWIFLTFPNVFTRENMDANLLRKITTREEMSGILSWGIEGLRRLLQTNIFTNSKATEDIRKTYVKLASPIRAFCMDCTEFGDENMQKNELYSAFILYCQKNNLPTIPSNIFSSKIREILPKVIEIWSDESGRNERVWRGVVLKSSENEEFPKGENIKFALKSSEKTDENTENTEKVTKSENKPIDSDIKGRESQRPQNTPPSLPKVYLGEKNICKNPLNGNDPIYVGVVTHSGFEGKSTETAPVFKVRAEILKMCENAEFFTVIYKNIMEKFPISDNDFDQIFGEIKSEGLIFSPEPEKYRKV